MNAATKDGRKMSNTKASINDELDTNARRRVLAWVCDQSEVVYLLRDPGTLPVDPAAYVHAFSEGPFKALTTPTDNS